MAAGQTARRATQKRKAEPWIIYVTADLVSPYIETQALIAEFHQKRPEKLPPRIGWLGWHHLMNVPSQDQ